MQNYALKDGVLKLRLCFSWQMGNYLNGSSIPYWSRKHKLVQFSSDELSSISLFSIIPSDFS